jgi:hypothetical protein
MPRLGDLGGAAPIIGLVALADIAIGAKHLQILRIKGKMGMGLPAFDVVHVQRHAMTPLAATA